MFPTAQQRAPVAQQLVCCRVSARPASRVLRIAGVETRRQRRATTPVPGVTCSYCFGYADSNAQNCKESHRRRSVGVPLRRAVECAMRTRTFRFRAPLQSQDPGLSCSAPARQATIARSLPSLALAGPIRRSCQEPLRLSQLAPCRSKKTRGRPAAISGLIAAIQPIT